MTEESEIKCGIFKTQEPHIKKATQLINSAQGAVQKAREAQNLLNEVDLLLTCVEYNDQNMDCQTCREIASLRKKTAELIIKASKLA